MPEIPKEYCTCYHHHHKHNDNIKCDHMLMCHDHDKWIPCTNGDYIRSMNDEELGRWLCDTGGLFSVLRWLLDMWRW